MDDPMDTNKKTREQISALSDGELPASDMEVAFVNLQAPDGRQAWEVFHLIGDVLRAQPSADLSPGFSAKLAARLAEEPMPIRRKAGVLADLGESALATAPRS
jgi:sigma-E factor negative regulatory protein RseA